MLPEALTERDTEGVWVMLKAAVVGMTLMEPVALPQELPE